MQELDRRMMLRALELARRGAGFVSPNPMVGGVITDEHGKIIGEGAHLSYGGPHAEPNAIADAESNGYSVRGATIYVSLEPHSHHSNTPPCSKLLIEKGIGKCIVAMQDPNPMVSGKGLQELRNAGIAVEVGLLEEEARELNKFFQKHVTTGLPYVTLKLATTLDGKSALASGASKWITSEASRKKVHAMRAEYDAVMIGAHTAIADNPSLTPYLIDGRSPKRIVLDAKLELPLDLQLFTDANQNQTTIITTAVAFQQSGARFVECGIDVLVATQDRERIDLRNVLEQLGKRNIVSVLVEAGPTLAASMVQGNHFDELALFIAPKFLGSDALASIGSLQLASIDAASRFRLKFADRIDGSDDLLLTLIPEVGARP